MTECINRRNRDFNDEQSGLCQRAQGEGELPKWGSEITILVKRLERAQWCTCAGNVSTLHRSPAGMFQIIYSEKENYVLTVCMFFIFFALSWYYKD